jgi:transaldolase
MKATQLLHNLGQSLWLDNITCDLLISGTLKHYVDELSVTGLTSNPTIFDHAIKNSAAYDAARRRVRANRASRSFSSWRWRTSPGRPTCFDQSTMDGWVSLEVSPLLAHDTASTLAAAKDLHARGRRPNLFIKIPGTKEGLPAIEGAIFAEPVSC